MDGRDDREARPQRDLLQHFLGEGDAHRDALDDLGEIAGRVVRRQQRELRAGGGRDRRHHALDHLAVERVDGDIDFLPRLDVGELGLLEVGVDVGGVERHERHQPGSRLHQVSDLEPPCCRRFRRTGASTRVNERLRSAISRAVTSSLRWRAASSFWALSTSRLAFAPSSAAAADASARLGGGQERRWCGHGRRSPARAAAASRNWSARAYTSGHIRARPARRRPRRSSPAPPPSHLRLAPGR